jgi:NAD-dependent DNA ligase
MLNIIQPVTFSSEQIDEDTILEIANTFDQPTFKSLLDFLNESYHNEEQLISDEVFDELVDLYEVKFQPYQVVGAEPTREKVILPYFLSSLNKIKEDKEIALFSSSYPGPYVVEDKIDGITLLLVYSPNQPTKLYTRGGGVRGVDVSHLLSYIKLPYVNRGSNLVIRGELVGKSRYVLLKLLHLVLLVLHNNSNIL